ncbi:MAG: hypothetical protein MI785_05955 [Kiloniellales bacterium]|nr:hypothetical protein [Kiloniellales bacterium]
MTTLRPHIQRPALRLLGGRETAATVPHESLVHESLAHDLRAKLGREGALRACRANGWAGALAVLLAEDNPGKAAA